ncbi:MAG: hypothetical protein M3220_09565 [Chloroflexota bacterium]|nr:hypothetical protein [Chloroflexota bacterium]
MLLAEPVIGTVDMPHVSLTLEGADIAAPASPSPRYVVLDLGRTVHGRVIMQVEGAADTIVDVGWDERLREGRALPAPGSLHMVERLEDLSSSPYVDGTDQHAIL